MESFAADVVVECAAVCETKPGARPHADGRSGPGLARELDIMDVLVKVSGALFIPLLPPSTSTPIAGVQRHVLFLL